MSKNGKRERSYTAMQKKFPRTIEVEQHSYLKSQRRNGDIRMLCEMFGVSNPTMTRIILYGHCNNMELLKSITDFYNTRENYERQKESKQKKQTPKTA